MLSENEHKGWWLHNLVGHPMMQIFLWLHLDGLADWIHDATIPKNN